MSVLLNKVKEDNLDNKSIYDAYKSNTLYFYNLYSKSSKEVMSINPTQIKVGFFYHLYYKDDSNWIKKSPVLCIGYKKYTNILVLLCVNFNFIPLEVRVSMLERFFTDKTFNKNTPINVDFDNMYNLLLKYGFEYSIIEYNINQIILSHKIDMNLVPKFLYSGDPSNKYDPIKLYDIWSKKIISREKRHQEMSKLLISDLFNIEVEFKDSFDILKKHITRVRNSFNKYN